LGELYQRIKTTKFLTWERRQKVLHSVPSSILLSAPTKRNNLKKTNKINLRAANRIPKFCAETWDVIIKE
jgi:hypothetical protein